MAERGADDLDEDAAARRVAQAALGPGLRLVGPGAGRANLVATGRGLLRVDAQRLLRLNQLEGITVATLLGHTPVRTGQVVATVKVIPFALPATVVRAAESAATEGGPLLRVDPIVPRVASLLLCGSTSARERVVRDFEPPLRSRLEALGATIRVRLPRSSATILIMAARAFGSLNDVNMLSSSLASNFSLIARWPCRTQSAVVPE